MSAQETSLPLCLCYYDGQCPDQCPELELDANSTRRCASCNHLASLHKPPISTSCSSTPAASIPVSHSSSAPRLPQAPPFGERWRTTLSSTRNRLVSEPVTTAVARAEVNAGYRPTLTRSKSVALSKPKAKGKGKLDGPKTRIRNTSATLLPIQGIYFVPEAFQFLTKYVNNSGKQVLEIACPSIKPAHKLHLQELGYGRVSTPDDPLRVDPSLDNHGTARFLATLFPAVFGFYLAEAGNPLDNIPPEDWFIQLAKSNRILNNIPGQIGASMKQLISKGSMNGGRTATREIYLAIPFKLEYIAPEKPLTKGKGKGKRAVSVISSDDSEEDSPLAKRAKMAKSDTESESESAVPSVSNRELRPRPRPKPLSFASHAGPSVAPDTPHSENQSPIPLSSPRQPSPTPTVLDDVLNMDETAASFSASLHLNDANSPSTSGQAIASAAPQTPLSREEKASKELFQFIMEGHFGPFDQTYYL
ncbi:hypothetical protein BDV93DRAFT_564638 [Ceratobasidium sp. AG-I]|nr:hypothetical protein BDV93DRAFT_564638 [Ceratobasidium sp. AG-I]